MEWMESQESIGSEYKHHDKMMEVILKLCDGSGAKMADFLACSSKVHSNYIDLIWLMIYFQL